uniref:Uncharacterized protein n=1 Tax=Oryctolagus cuniculus TaxID=9986 RepID=A0A5F9D9A2_RABIT
MAPAFCRVSRSSSLQYSFTHSCSVSSGLWPCTAPGEQEHSAPAPAPPRPAPAHLLGPESNGRAPLDEQLGHLEVAAVEGIMQGRDALAALAAWVIHCGPVLQQEADDVCGQAGRKSVPGALLRPRPAPPAPHLPLTHPGAHGCRPRAEVSSHSSPEGSQGGPVSGTARSLPGTSHSLALARLAAPMGPLWPCPALSCHSPGLAREEGMPAHRSRPPTPCGKTRPVGGRQGRSSPWPGQCWLPQTVPTPGRPCPNPQLHRRAPRQPPLQLGRPTGVVPHTRPPILVPTEKCPGH